MNNLTKNLTVLTLIRSQKLLNIRLSPAVVVILPDTWLACSRVSEDDARQIIRESTLGEEDYTTPLELTDCTSKILHIYDRMNLFLKYQLSTLITLSTFFEVYLYLSFGLHTMYMSHLKLMSCQVSLGLLAYSGSPQQIDRAVIIFISSLLLI